MWRPLLLCGDVLLQLSHADSPKRIPHPSWRPERQCPHAETHAYSCSILEAEAAGLLVGFAVRHRDPKIPSPSPALMSGIRRWEFQSKTSCAGRLTDSAPHQPRSRRRRRDAFHYCFRVTSQRGFRSLIHVFTAGVPPGALKQRSHSARFNEQ